MALARRDAFAQSTITLVDRSDPSQPGAFPSPDAASVDTSRIIRADYADPAYAALGDEAQVEWRKRDKPTDLGAQGRYHEAGLILVGDQTPPSLPHVPPAAAAPAAEGLKPKLTGLDYTRKSWANVLSLASKNPELAARLRELPNSDAIREALGTGGSSGQWGYINHNSGWGDAAASMAWFLDQVRQTGRVNLIPATVVSLEHNEDTVTGAKLSDGRVLSADLVVVATGAWTGGLVDLAGQAVATGQVLGYLDLTQAEQDQLSKMPVILNLSTGLFIIPPSNRVLKVARHAYGYINPTTTSHPPLPLSPTTTPNPTTSTIPLPLTTLTNPTLTIPTEGATALRSALQSLIPWPSLQTRPFSKTRLCWYSDTPTGDFLIDYHPHWHNLFVATGDSGHAFKFLPVIGEKVADCIARNTPEAFRGKWGWKAGVEGFGTGLGGFTEDGSRGGRAGLVLAEELARLDG